MIITTTEATTGAVSVSDTPIKEDKVAALSEAN